MPTCGSPRIIAACRALLRLSVPRHPPCALLSLDRIMLAEPWLAARHSGPPSLHTRFGALARARSPYAPDSFPSTQPTTRAFNQLQTFESALTNARPVRTFCSEELTRRSRKEVIQPQVPLRLPCYDFAPVTELAFGGSLPCRLGHRLRALPTPMA